MNWFNTRLLTFKIFIDGFVKHAKLYFFQVLTIKHIQNYEWDVKIRFLTDYVSSSLKMTSLENIYNFSSACRIEDELYSNMYLEWWCIVPMHHMDLQSCALCF